MICSGGDQTDEGREDSQTMLLHCSSDGLSGSFPTMMGDDGLSASFPDLPKWTNVAAEKDVAHR